MIDAYNTFRNASSRGYGDFLAFLESTLMIQHLTGISMLKTFAVNSLMNGKCNWTYAPRALTPARFQMSM